MRESCSLRFCPAAFTAVSFLFLFGIAAAAGEDDPVLVLDESSWDNAIKGNRFILVEFYAPWCGHCTQLAPEYASAARQLQPHNVPLAKLDVSTEVRIAEEQNVRGYPTIRLYSDGRMQEYFGAHTEQAIVTWVLKKIGPIAVSLKDVAEAEAFEQEHKIGVIAFFDSDDASARTPFEAVARGVEDVMFAYTSSHAVAARYKLSPPAVRMHTPHNDGAAKYAGDMQNVDDMEKFVKAYKRPLISTFSGENSADLFGDGRPILFLFREQDEKGEAAQHELAKAAPSFDHRVLVAVAGSTEPLDMRLMDYVTVEPEEFPTLRLVVNPAAGMRKYRMEGEISDAAIRAFVQGFEAGKLRAHYKSEPPPTSQPGPVHFLVGSTFHSIVMDPTKDVLVEFYAPWCGHCKKLEPVFKELAKKLKPVDTLVIAKLDATTNDVEGVDTEGFPTIKLWRADNKDVPIDYDGDRDVDSFIVWLEEKVTHAFDKGGLRTEL